MNIKTSLGLLFMASLLFVSCKEELKIQDNPSVDNQTIIENTNPSVITAAPTSDNQGVTVANKVTTTPYGMNPPHGEPGHRCEIAVGAPLNSKPQAAPVATPQPTVIANPNTRQITAPGMNPPHGEPGHLCEIAVGAPLPKK